MIAPLPDRLLKLVSERAEETIARAPEHATRDGLMQTLIAQGKQAGLSSSYIADSLDRRIRAYLDKVGNRGEGDRDNTAFRIACWLLRDFGASDAVALAYLIEWNAGNTPPLSERQLQLKLVAAKRSGRRPAGCAHDGRRGSAA